MSPQISVIIPNYNHADYLRQRIQSVLDQTYQPFEIFLLDDASTDASQKILMEYEQHPRITRIVVNEKNSGNPFSQWKRGIDLASGDWIWIAESDDYADKHFLERLTTAVKGKTSVGLAYSDSRIVATDGTTGETFAAIKNRKFNTARWSDNYANRGVSEIEDYLLPEGTINNTSAVLFNKEVLIRANPFDVSFRYIGDMYAFLKVLAISDVVYVGEVLNYYRDPFSSKHQDKLIYYLYEQFLTLDWVYRHVPVSKQKFFYAFYKNTRNSVYRNWSTRKFSIYSKLFAVNPRLMLYSMLNNIISPFKKSTRAGT